MRDTHWIDASGKRWRVASSRHRICFRYPANRALRAFVYARDGFCCVGCGWEPPAVPAGYDGQFTLIGPDENGKRQELQLDHVLALYNGGTHHPDNLQTLCFQCNTSKGASL